jgi:hypothetical protein
VKQHDYNRQTLAAHEAGHAVVGLALGLALRSVSIYPYVTDPSNAGRTRLAVPIAQYTSRQICIWKLAGPESERQFTKRPRAQFATKDYADVRALIELTRTADDPPLDAVAAEHEAMAKALVMIHDSWIKTVASALLRYEILWADSVAALRPR